MKLMHVAGYTRTGALDATQAAALDATALAYLKAGGVLSLDDWRDLDAAERAALAKARLVLDVLQARRIALALSGPAGDAENVAAIDGGDLVCANLCVDAAEAISRSLSDSGVKVQS